jgi:hypothetical protein
MVKGGDKALPPFTNNHDRGTEAAGKTWSKPSSPAGKSNRKITKRGQGDLVARFKVPETWYAECNHHVLFQLFFATKTDE